MIDDLPPPRVYTRPGAAPPGARAGVERELGNTFDSTCASEAAPLRPEQARLSSSAVLAARSN